MSTELILERKKPLFISKEFTTKRMLTDTDIRKSNLIRTAAILSVLTFTVLAATVFVLLNQKRKQHFKNKEALAYEVW